MENDHHRFGNEHQPSRKHPYQAAARSTNERALPSMVVHTNPHRAIGSSLADNVFMLCGEPVTLNSAESLHSPFPPSAPSPTTNYENRHPIAAIAYWLDPYSFAPTHVLAPVRSASWHEYHPMGFHFALINPIDFGNGFMTLTEVLDRRSTPAH